MVELDSLRPVARREMDECLRGLRAAQRNCVQRITTHTRACAVSAILGWRQSRTDAALEALEASGEARRNRMDGSWWACDP